MISTTSRCLAGDDCCMYHDGGTELTSLTYHDNMKMLCDSLSNEMSSFPTYSRSFPDNLVCDSSNEECKGNLHQQDVVLFPCNNGQSKHWFLGVVLPKERCIIVLDSLPGPHVKPCATRRVEKMISFLQLADQSVDIKNWSFYANKPCEIPQQENGFDCGIFTCLYARCLATRCSMVTQQHIPAYRQLMIQELHQKSLSPLPPKPIQHGEYYAVAYVNNFYFGRVLNTTTDVVELKYMFDEPSSYLDVKQRLNAAKTIRSLLTNDKYIIVVEHDLSVLDYLSDFICCLYGTPGAYGVVTMPFSVREGINIFLDGFVPTENLRFRETSLVFKVSETADKEEEIKRIRRYAYPAMFKKLKEFQMNIVKGEFTDSEIIVMLGENGTGKTTFIRMLAGKLSPDNDEEVPMLNVSYKPQKISPKSEGTVRQLFHTKIRDAYIHPQFIADVIKPLQLESIMDQEVPYKSDYLESFSYEWETYGTELRSRVFVSQPADVYLIDEPSAYLDSEQRLVAAKVIKRFILHAKKTGFVVEHDFIMATYLADRVIVFEGIPSIKTVANAPQTLLSGMNKFLGSLEITFRRDPTNFRPRINKLNSVKDVDQKRGGNYFFLED
ncbi:hypothetical protein QZH41_015781 [Actinostola sp. cb2023]|nr:hypothetical protein QZH41_015781 [Actinostola sp. cb2023]